MDPSDPLNDSLDQPVAIDLSRKKRRKRILFVKRSATPTGNPALATTSADSRIEEQNTIPSAPAVTTPRGINNGRTFPPRQQSNSPKRPILVAHKMPAYLAEQQGMLSPLKSPTKGIVNETSGKVMERRILGTADDYVDMFQEENPGVPVGFDVSRVGSVSALGSPKGSPMGSPKASARSASIAIDSDEQQRADAARNALANAGDAKVMQEMIASETVAANRSDDPYRYRLESAVLRAARRSRIADARSREKEEEHEDESDMLVCDRVVEQREAHALENWKQMQITWSKAKKVLAKKLKKHPDDLVLSRAEEFREKREEYDLIDNAIPLHLKHGSEYWMMSLRGVGTRYVPVGNIFSGLFCPVHEDKASEPLVIRAPGVRVPLDQRTDRPKNWRDAKNLVEKQRVLRRRIDDLRPHLVDTLESNALMVEGVDLFDWAERTSTAYYRRRDMEEGNSNKHVEFEDQLNSDLSDSTGTNGVDAAAAAQELKEREIAAQRAQQGPRINISIEGQPPRDVVNGTPMRLLLQSKVGLETLRNVDVQNVGSTALYIVTSKNERTGENNALGELRGDGSSKCQVHCHKQQCVVLPGQSLQIPFSFKSNIPGVFSENWSVQVTPSPVDGTNPISIVIRAVSIEEDQGSTRRAMLEERIATKVAERTATKAAKIAAQNVQPPPPTKDEIVLQEFKSFETKTKGRFGDLNLHYGSTIYSQFNELFQNANNLNSANNANNANNANTADNTNDANTSTETWNGDLTNLANSIESISGSDDIKKKMREEMRNMETISMIPLPSSQTSPSWTPAYELLMSVALSIPDLSDTLRAEKGLEVQETWVRPRNLRNGGIERVPDVRIADQINKGWLSNKNVPVVVEDGSEPPPAVELTNEDQYLEAMWSSVRTQLMNGLDSFVDSALTNTVSNTNTKRKERKMLLSTKYSLWSKLPDEDEDEEEPEEEEKENIEAVAGGEGEENETVPVAIDHVAASIASCLNEIVNSRIMVRLDTSGLAFDTDNGARVLSDESPATELQLLRASECVQQLLRANAGAIILVGTSKTEENFKPFSDALAETLDRPVRFCSNDEDAMPIIVSFEEKRRLKEEARMQRMQKAEEKRVAAEARRVARLEAGGDGDEEEEEEEEDEEEDEDEDEDEEGTCPVIMLENRALFPCERLAYRSELHELAEEEDIDERNAEMDAYSKVLGDMCDILMNDDLSGSSTNDVTICSLTTKKQIYIAGPRMQFELSILEQLVQETPRPAFGVVGGVNLREKLSLLDALIDVMDEIMLGANLSPMFERVQRERWFKQHPLEVEDVEATNNTTETAANADADAVETEVGATTVDSTATEEDGENGGDGDADNSESSGAPLPVVLTKEEDLLLPAVRYLVQKATGKGVVLHTCLDYVIGDVPPSIPEDGNYEIEYSGEVTEYNIVPLVDPKEEAAAAAAAAELASAEGEEMDAAAVVEGGGEEEEEEEEEDDDEEQGEKLPPNDPRVVRALHGMPPSTSYILDIGPVTQETWAKELSRAKSVMWLDSVGSIAHADFAAGSQALLEALMPEDTEEEGSGEDAAEGEAAAETEAASDATPKRLVAMFGEDLVGAMRFGGMSDEDLTLVSSGNAKTMSELLGGSTPGIQQLSEIPAPVIVEVVEEVAEEVVEE